MTLAKYVDISSHNGNPDLAAYRAAGHTDLMLKATEGTGYAWAQMQALARQWHAFGPQYRCGYYHWLYGTFSGAAQFAWFWQHVAPVFRTGDLLMTDFEDVDASRWVSDARHLAVVREFNALCDQRAPTLDYAPNWYLANMPLCVAYFKTRPWWVPSDYSHDPPLNPNGFAAAAHQFTDKATVAGFAGPVDYNVWINDPATATTGDDMPYLDWPQRDRAALSADVASAIVNRPLGGVGYNGTVAAILAQILGTARTTQSVQAALVTLPSLISDQLKGLPAGTPVDTDALAKAVVTELSQRLDTPATP